MIDQIIQTFAILDGDADAIFKDKMVNVVKINTYSRVDVMCYLFDGVPLVFEYESRIVPTGMAIIQIFIVFV